MTLEVSNNEMVAIASTIKRQIGPMALMSCGAHEFQALGNGLRFKVGGRQRWCEVRLDPTDTYSVKVFRVTFRGLEHREIVEYSGDDIYCDVLAEVIRREADRA